LEAYGRREEETSANASTSTYSFESSYATYAVNRIKIIPLQDCVIWRLKRSMAHFRLHSTKTTRAKFDGRVSVIT
jgi:hypothetical protein